MDYNKLQVIDFDIKGSAIKLALGCPDENGDWTNHDWSAEWTSYRPEPSTSYYGDDWDDHPYEHNAGEVYEWFEKGSPLIIHFPYNYYVLEPCDGEGLNSGWCKDDMVARKVPCLVIVPDAVFNEDRVCYYDNFSYWVTHDRAIKIYFGDTVETVLSKLEGHILAKE